MNLFRRIINIGVTPQLTKDELKKVKLLNFLVLFNDLITTVFIGTDLLFAPNPMLNNLVHVGGMLGSGIIFLLQYKRKYIWARLFYPLIIAFATIIFSFWLEPREFIEFFLLTIPLIYLLLFENKWVHLLSLLGCFSLFYYCMSTQYDFSHLNPLILLALFLSVYLGFRYTITQNRNAEKLLLNQKDKAVADAHLIAKQHRELEELSKFQSYFLINLSHEIRTPLTLINGQLKQLEAYHKDVKLAEISHQIQLHSTKIKGLVDNIMDLSKMNNKSLELQLKPLDISVLCQKLYLSFESLMKTRQIHMSYQLNSNNAWVLGDLVYLERALSNILLNAYKYTPNGGTVELSISVASQLVSVVVEDSGCGIPLEDQNKVFDMFYQASNAVNESGGSGIGLSFAKEVMLLHQGQIFVNSEEGIGSRFTIQLPLSDDIPSDKTLLEPPISTTLFSDNSMIKILIVEDHREMAAYLKQVLSKYSVSVAHNGKQAMEMLPQTMPHLIITDYMMPEMDGYEFVKELKSKGYEIPVIVLTARMDKEGRLNFLRLGIDDYMLKPFDEAEILIRVQNSIKNNQKRVSYIDHAPMAEEKFSNQELEQLMQVVMEQIGSSNFQVTDLAELLSTTERTLQRKIKMLSGLSPNEFIREARLQKARRIVEAQEVQSFKELSLDVGFKNVNYFIKLYEERFGIKPALEVKVFSMH